MLTRLRVRGFKNLVNAELRFGPFTCVAGANGVGKSNVFDAIHFLSLLADKPFVEAASEVRGGGELGDLFAKGGDGHMAFECDVLIPPSGSDDFNQEARASATFLRYALELRFDDGGPNSFSRIRLCNENLAYITGGDAKAALGFAFEPRWLKSVLVPSRRRMPFISTPTKEPGDPVVMLHLDRMQAPDKDKRGGGKPSRYALGELPRTVLSSAQNADETRTAVLLRQEMRKWRQLQLEPTALRRPDNFRDTPRVGSSGAHVPAALYRLATASADPDSVYAEVANRLAELVDGVRTVCVDKDDGRKLLQLMMKDRRGIELPASSLSDGTLRFIALAVMEQDPEATGILCFEEPENGIHPGRIAAMLRLLKDMSVSPTERVDDDNPLRQVIVTTHSPALVAQADPADVIFAQGAALRIANGTVQSVTFAGVDGTWRQGSGDAIPPGVLLRYIAEFLGPPADGCDPGAAPRISQMLGVQLDLPLQLAKTSV